MYKIIKYGQLPNGEIIEWYVMKQDEEEIVLLAVNGIDAVKYKEIQSKDWLNEVFIQKYFTKEEKERIRSVYIPSTQDIKQCLLNENERICFPTKYALSHEAAVFYNFLNKELSCVYWLCDEGRRAGESITIVTGNGKIYKSAFISADNVCVRPMMNIMCKGKQV